ncbi:MAG: hypothetical protein XXXJIFNMEKO3_01867 [Candidatus Erwinia impunctatus]|nr:hypothetical protein XXXJIFNMEKO_01867 [Culicoides impunctatus]
MPFKLSKNQSVNLCFPVRLEASGKEQPAVLKRSPASVQADKQNVTQTFSFSVRIRSEADIGALSFRKVYGLD